MDFTVEEMSVMCIFDTSNRKGLIAQMRESLPDVDDEEMSALMQSVISRLDGMNDVEFAAITFASVFEDDEADEETEV